MDFSVAHVVGENENDVRSNRLGVGSDSSHRHLADKNGKQDKSCREVFHWISL